MADLVDVFVGETGADDVTKSLAMPDMEEQVPTLTASPQPLTSDPSGPTPCP